MLRDLQSKLVGELVVVPGIITSASKTSIKATKVVLRCSHCSYEKIEHLKAGFASVQIPR